MKLLQMVILIYLSIVYVSTLAARELPTTEEFYNLLSGCALGAKLDVSTDMLGSIKDIYEGNKTQGKASISTQSAFLDKMPEKDRLKAYELYTVCVSTLLSSPSTKPEKIAYLSGSAPDAAIPVAKSPGKNTLAIALEALQSGISNQDPYALLTRMNSNQYWVADGTEIKILDEAVPSSEPIAGLSTSVTKVEIMDGEHAGKVGYAPSHLIKYKYINQ